MSALSWVTVVVLAWLVLSVPASLLMGRVFALGSRRDES